MRRLIYAVLFPWAVWLILYPLILELELRRIEAYNQRGETYTERDRLDGLRGVGRAVSDYFK